MPTTTTFYAGTGNGDVYKQGTTGTWDATHDALAGDGVTVDTNGVRCGVYGSADSFQIYRAFFPFDTSSLPDGAVVSSADLTLYLNYNDSSTACDMLLVQTTQAATNTVATADYDQCGAVNSPTEGATRKSVNATSTAYTWNLNATGISWISKTGYTKLGIRQAFDADDTANYGKFYKFNHASAASNKPALAITYTTGLATISHIDGTPTANISYRNGVKIADVKTISNLN